MRGVQPIQAIDMAVHDRGTLEHQEKLRKDLQNLEVFHKKGTRVKLGGWGSWFKACRSWQGQRGACLLVLLYEGVNRGWWDDHQSLPLQTLADIAQRDADHDKAKGAQVEASASSSGGPGAASSLTSASSSSGAPRQAASAVVSSSVRPASSVVPLGKIPVKDPEAEVKRLKKTSPHKLAFCAQLLGNSFSCGIAQVILHVCQPIVEWIDKMKTACNTPWGSENWHIEIIQGSMLDLFAQSWDLFSCPADLEDCGFLAMCNWKSYTKFEREGENKLAQVMFEVYS